MSRILGVFVFLFGLSTSAHVELWSDSGIRGPAYQHIIQSMYELASNSEGWVTPIEYGLSVDKRRLLMVKIASPNVNTQRKAIVISGSTHGNEYLNIADRLPGWFFQARETHAGVQSFFSEGGVIYIVPILNPDGYETRRRKNRRGADLNRDFALIPLGEGNFRQPETRLLAEALENELQANNLSLKVSVDYHCCDGSLLYPWSYTKSSLPADDLEAHQFIGQLMKDHINSRYRTGSTGQVLGYTPKGTSKDYYYAQYGALAYTFEGAYRKEHLNFKKHQVWWNAILDFVAGDAYFN